MWRRLSSTSSLCGHAGNNGDAALVTELELSAVDEEIDYHFQGQGSQSLSFNLKDFKVRVFSNSTWLVVQKLFLSNRPGF